jgi:2-desacetyl-2-hydroxyethyl bacteriochlorophyllide A dehydrogenase
MKAVVFEAKNNFSITDFPDPELKDDEVLVKVAACGLCGTDLHILNGKYPSTFPLIPGHEFAGTIVRVGSAVKEFTSGDRVCIDPNIFCRRCLFCRQGKVHLCEHLFPIGVRRHGGFAEFCAVPQSQLFSLPKQVDFNEGALIEPLSCALHGIELAQVRSGQTVLVLGGGAMGGLLIQLARLAGAARVIVSEPIPERRKLLLEMGADAAIDPISENPVHVLTKITPGGADVVFEAAGLARTARQAFSLTRRGGTIIFFGVVPPHEKIEISPYEIYSNEWTIRGSFINPHTLQSAVDLLTARRLNVKPFISHQFTLDEFQKALDTFGRPDSYKIQLIPSS